MGNILYEKIGKIAHSANSPITFEELKDMLNLDTNNRGIANHIKGAYNYLKKKGDDDSASKITGVFIDSNGKYAYKK